MIDKSIFHYRCYFRIVSSVIAAAMLFAGSVPADAEGDSIHGVTELVPVGHTTGIKLYTDGVMVVGVQNITTEKGEQAPALSAGIFEGDVITNIGSEKINSSEEFIKILQRSGGQPVTVRLNRDGHSIQTNVTPVKAAIDDRYRIGAWVRDSMAGIGTITFYDPRTGQYGALGHGINDVDTGKLLPLREGNLVYSTVSSVKKGENGNPGELRGNFSKKISGTVQENTASGVFGKLSDLTYLKNPTPMPVARARDAKVGEACILSNVNGDSIDEYKIEITRVYPKNNGDARGMTIKITDPRLIDKTNGIVQGMSGSPIIQDGKLVGAVTHVFVNDSLRGYAIFIENMLDKMYSLSTSEK